MVTEQVKRIQAALREAGFKRGDFTVQAERKRKRDRMSGLRYTEFGAAVGTSRHGGDVVERVLDGGAERIVAAGLMVEVCRLSGSRPFVAVREPDYIRTGADGKALYERARVIERDLDAEIAEINSWEESLNA